MCDTFCPKGVSHVLFLLWVCCIVLIQHFREVGLYFLSEGCWSKNLGMNVHRQDFLFQVVGRLYKQRENGVFWRAFHFFLRFVQRKAPQILGLPLICFNENGLWLVFNCNIRSECAEKDSLGIKIVWQSEELSSRLNITDTVEGEDTQTLFWHTSVNIPATFVHFERPRLEVGSSL